MNVHSEKSGVLVYYCRNAAYDDNRSSAIGRLEARDDVTLQAVPCSGKIDPRYLMKAFEDGAQAVCVLACPTGHCRLMEGNFRLVNRTHMVSRMLSEAGIDPDSVHVFMPNGEGAEGAVNDIMQYLDGRSAQEFAVWQA